MPAQKHPVPDGAAEKSSPTKRTRATAHAVKDITDDQPHDADSTSHANDSAPIDNDNHPLAERTIAMPSPTIPPTTASEPIEHGTAGGLSTSPVNNYRPNINDSNDTESSTVSDDEDDSQTGTSVISIAGFAYTQKFSRRVTTLADYVDNEHHIYGIRKLPASSTWGKGRNESTLCINNEPVVVYIVGEIVNSSFLFMREPKKRATVTVNTLRSIDLLAANTLIRRIAEWREDDSPAPTTITAGTRQSRKGKREGDWTTSLFNNVWDAKRRLEDKHDDFRLTVEGIGINDVVMLECMITRWRINAEGKTLYTGSWHRWKAAFDFRNIYLLKVGPNPEDPPPVPVNDFTPSL